MELNPSGHKLKPYGLNDKELRCYLIYLKNKDLKTATLAQVVRKLIMWLEPKDYWRWVDQRSWEELFEATSFEGMQSVLEAY